MLVNLDGAFKYNIGHATGAFNVTNLESLQAIIESAEILNKAVILNYAEVHEPYISLDTIGPIMVEFAKKSKVPVCVHLDHATNIESCVKALKIGFSSVMFDASNKDFETNVTGTKKMVEIAHNLGATVEAELGNILVHEETETTEHGVSIVDDLEQIYTDPEKAKEFVEKTKVDALAIAFGTVHGFYRKKPVLDLNRIKKIAEKIDTPLVMHGGSGLSKEEFQQSIKNGIRKINYYTYMALAGGNTVKDYILENKGREVLFHDLALIGKEGMKKDITNAIKIFSFIEV